MTRYRARIRKSRRHWLVRFADCPGCVTQGDTRAEALQNAHEALEGWIEAHLAEGIHVPRPVDTEGTPIAVNPRLSMALQIRWRRTDLQLTQMQLAYRLGVTQQQVAKLETPSGNPTLMSLVKITRALGMKLEVNFAREDT